MNEDSIFLAALEKGSAEARAAFLDGACAGNAELRESVERLLRAHARASEVLRDRAPGLPATAESGGRERPGLQIGPYKLVEQIGEGGMGTVWMAQQSEPVKRLVAVKLVKPGMDSRQVIARFEAERQALALMDHANIARVLDAGATESGRPYFVMDLVRGVPITRYCDEHRLTPRQRLELFIPVCHAVQHAHQKGIIHRDLKPSNVLVAVYDGRPVPKVIDFGVAKATGQPLTEQTLVTGFGNIVGTLEYMSPEQAETNQLDVDTRSDIYSLGVLLYELLTGSPPFCRKELEQAGMLERLRVIREQEPSKPSAKLSTAEGLPTLAANRGTEPAKLTKLVRGELDWIVMKALEKDRSRRYETANGFAQDMQRYLADEPVLAGPPSANYRFRKFARRNRGAILTASLVAAALLLGTAVSTWQAIRATLAEGRERENAKQADTQRGIAVKNAAKAKERELEAKKQTRLAQDNERLANRRYYAAQMNLAARAWEEGDTPRVLELLETVRPRIGEDDLRAFEWYAFWQLCHERLRYRLQGNHAFSHRVAYSPDSRLLALASTDGTVKLLDAISGQEIRTLRGGRSRTGAVAFSPVGKLLAQEAGPNAESVILWNVESGEQTRMLANASKVQFLDFSPDGQTLATGTYDGNVILWDTSSGSRKDAWQAHGITAIAFAPDGRHLATTRYGAPKPGEDATTIWDVGVTPAVRVAGSEAAAGQSLSFSADGKRLAVGGPIACEIVDATSGKIIPFIDERKGDWGYGYSVAFVPGRDALALGLESSRVRVVDLKTGSAQIFPHQSQLRSIAVSPDGRSIAAIDSDALLKVWNLEERPPSGVFETNGTQGLAFSRDGQTLAVGSMKTLKIYDLSTGALQADLKGHISKVSALAFFRDGKTLAAGSGYWSQPGEFKLWDLATGRERIPAPTYNLSSIAVAVSPDEKTLAVGGPQGELVLFELATARPLARVEARQLTGLTFTPDGKLLISAGGEWRNNSSEYVITLRDPASGAVLKSFAPTESVGFCVIACSADGKLLAAGTRVGLVHLWELPSGRLRKTLRGSTLWINSIAFFPDGETLATAHHPGDIKLWDLATGQERITFRLGHRLAVSADGQLLATGGNKVVGGNKVRVLRASNAPEALAFKRDLDPDDSDSAQVQNDAGEVGSGATSPRRSTSELAP